MKTVKDVLTIFKYHKTILQWVIFIEGLGIMNNKLQTK